MEIWKIYKDPYWISNYGNVKNTKTGNFLKGSILQQNGYKMFHLRQISEHQLGHRMVAIVFIDNDNPKTKTQVNHKDSNKLNNHVSNLEWVTPKENMHHSFNNGTQKHEMKPIYCFSLDGDFIAKYTNASEAAEQQIGNHSARNTIWRAASGGKTNIAYKLWWTYSPTFLRKKKVFVYNKEDNTFINSYYSQKDCCEDLKISAPHLSQCLSGSKNHSKYNFIRIE